MFINKNLHTYYQLESIAALAISNLGIQGGSRLKMNAYIYAGSGGLHSSGCAVVIAIGAVAAGAVAFRSYPSRVDPCGIAPWRIGPWAVDCGGWGRGGWGRGK